MASSAAIRKLKKEYSLLSTADGRVVGAEVRPLDSNFLHAHFLLHGEPFFDTPYEGGVYHGLLKFPKDYPFGPPTIMFRTPSGRFVLDKRICFSMSDFHKESWNPAWTCRTILTGLISFMNSDEITTGGMQASASVRTKYAQQSLSYCRNTQKDPLAMQIFSDFLDALQEQRQSAKDSTAWPPVRPVSLVSRCADGVPDSGSSTHNETATGVNSLSNARAKNRALRAKKRLQQPKVENQQEEEQQAEQQQQQEEDQVESTSNGKNASKNKKKRDREKRKKLAIKFLTELRQSVPTFVSLIVSKLSNEFGIQEVSSNLWETDHVCYRTETLDEYTDLVAALQAISSNSNTNIDSNNNVNGCTLLIESEIGGRPIATFSLNQAISCGDSNHSVSVVEIPSPKPGRPYKSGLEHVEFVVPRGSSQENNKGDTTDDVPLSPVNDKVHQATLDNLMQRYPSLSWNIKAKNKEFNPDISLTLELVDFGRCSAKFHLMPLADVIEAEKRLANVKDVIR